MKIQSNIQSAQYKNSINTQKINERQQQKNAREVASGKKVNTAADDAVVLQISEELLKQMNALKAGTDNISAGKDMLNIADGAMANITESLGDMETNTIRAMNGLYSDSDREILQDANEAATETIRHIAETTKYNEINPLDGSSQQVNIYTGNSGRAITNASLEDTIASLENFTVATDPDAIDTEALDEAFANVQSARSTIGAQMNGLESAATVNRITEENEEASYSRMTDAQMNEAISRYKASAALGAAQNMALANQMATNSNLVTRMMQ